MPEILIVVILTLMQGFFSGSEIALISLRRSKTNELIKKSIRRGSIVRKLQSNPENFIATTQIGISLLTIVTSVFAGSRLEAKLAPYLEVLSIPFVHNHANGTSFVVIVLLLTYFNLVVGELVPKSLALRYPEKFSLWAAYPVLWISKLSLPLIKIVVTSSNLLLRPFRDSTSFSESKLSEEEIRTVLYEGRQAGTIERQEHEILENVFELSEMEVEKIMTPANKMVALDLDESLAKNLEVAISSEYTRIPVYRGSLDNLQGVLNVKELLPFLGKDQNTIDLESLITPPLFVPSTQKIGDTLQAFQKNKIHIAFVTNEHGEVDGLVTLEDTLEEIVGEIIDESDEVNSTIVKQKDAFLVQGGTLIVDFNRHFKTEIPENENFATVSGLILDVLGRFPNSNDVITAYDCEFKVLEKTDRVIKKVLVKKAPN